MYNFQIWVCRLSVSDLLEDCLKMESGPVPRQTKWEFWGMGPRILHEMWILPSRHIQVFENYGYSERNMDFCFVWWFYKWKISNTRLSREGSIVNHHYPDSAVFKILSHLFHQSPFFLPKYLKVNPRYCHFTRTYFS